MTDLTINLEVEQACEIYSSVCGGAKTLPTINLYAVGPAIGSLLFNITMTKEQAEIMIDKLCASCAMLEAKGHSENTH